MDDNNIVVIKYVHSFIINIHTILYTYLSDD